MGTKFERQLEELHVELITLGSLCEKAISLSARAIQGEGEKLAHIVFETDKEIDAKEREIETHCLSLLLHQHPVAKDLRAVSAALKMVSDMERIGDQAADIADIARYIDKSVAIPVDVEKIAASAEKMVTECVDAFVKSDLELCRQVIQDDDVVDASFDEIKDKLAKLIYGGEMDAKAGLDLLMAAKYFERIGDHAVNIAEWVEYSIIGEHRNNEHQQLLE
ncbi:MAG: phosphate signaling complex protein PhoU [Eubacteriales bacterium]|nr:phosphate signaling complex protein PhoU [Eubacteriales bacterium]